jgi:hypothetical protein
MDRQARRSGAPEMYTFSKRKKKMETTGQMMEGGMFCGNSEDPAGVGFTRTRTHAASRSMNFAPPESSL